MTDPLENYLADSILSFQNYKKLAERALEQISDDEFFQQIDSESNSIGLIVKHIAGNLISRWTDFLTSDGEKPDRHRDTEFENIDDTRESLLEFWNRGWETLFASLDPLKPEDLSRTVTIRGEPHTVVEAINRQLTHYSYHVGQIIFLAKHFKNADWTTLSVAKNRSDEFNEFLRSTGSEGKNRFESVESFTRSENK
jgi:uncharacterized damage-inducible protein DinB